MPRRERRDLNGFVQIGDAYLSGQRNSGKPCLSKKNRQIFVIAKEIEANLDHSRLAVVEAGANFDTHTITDWAQRRRVVKKLSIQRRFQCPPSFRGCRSCPNLA